MKVPFELLNHPAYHALGEKITAGFRYISGSHWEERADYAHFPLLVRHLYKMAHRPDDELPDDFKAPLMFMFAGHAGRTRKGIRRRPYFHHVLMVVYAVWVLRLPFHIQMAAINHDDIEDVPENWKVSETWVKAQLRQFLGEMALSTVSNLTNIEHPDGKHAGQMLKMASMPLDDAILKLVDRLINLYDMRQDKPKNFTPERIRQECLNALALAEAMPEPAPEPVQAMLLFAIVQLARENNISLSAA